MHHLRGFLRRVHLREQVLRALLCAQPPVLVGIQLPVVVEILELIAVRLDDALYPRAQLRLDIRILRADGHRAERKQPRQGKGQKPLCSLHMSFLLPRCQDAVTAPLICPLMRYLPMKM